MTAFKQYMCNVLAACLQRTDTEDRIEQTILDGLVRHGAQQVKGIVCAAATQDGDQQMP